MRKTQGCSCGGCDETARAAPGATIPFLRTSNVGAPASIIMTMAMLACFKLCPSIWAWFGIRFVFGMAAGTLFTVSEAWILSGAEPGNRGRVMGFYTSILAISFSIGPLIIPVTGINSWLPWLIGIACVGMSAIPLAFLHISEA